MLLMENLLLLSLVQRMPESRRSGDSSRLVREEPSPPEAISYAIDFLNCERN